MSDLPDPILDPRTAEVGFCWDYIVPGGNCVGRVYYWYDTEETVPAMDDSDLRELYPGIPSDEWRQLRRAAFARGEERFNGWMLDAFG